MCHIGTTLLIAGGRCWGFGFHQARGLGLCVFNPFHLVGMWSGMFFPRPDTGYAYHADGWATMASEKGREHVPYRCSFGDPWRSLLGISFYSASGLRFIPYASLASCGYAYLCF